MCQFQTVSTEGFTPNTCDETCASRCISGFRVVAQPVEDICAGSPVPNMASALGGACWQKPNRLAWCRHIVFASLIKHQQGADERARAFAMTQSCMAQLRRTLWTALRSSRPERDRCHPISNQTTRSAANRSIPQGEPRFVLECLTCPTLP